MLNFCYCHLPWLYVIDKPLCGIQKQISTSSFVRKLIALTFIRVSLAYMEYTRIYEGKCLTKNKQQPSYVYSMLDWLWARTIAAILFPVHLLAKRLVYSKIHSAIGISKVIGSVGHPVDDTEFKVVDSETVEILPPGSMGILKVRGPQVMKGYFKNPSATNQAIDGDGWLNTGDIGWVVPHHSIGRSRKSGGVIVVDGRAKDTIVLSTGENVEPAELEEAAMRSSLIQQIVVVGQDVRISISNWTNPSCKGSLHD